MSNSTQRALRAFLDDLTHLEVNTIISSGMIAGAPPKSAEEMLSGIFVNYRERVDVLIRNNNLQFEFDENNCTSFASLSATIKDLRGHMDADLEHRRLKDDDFPLIKRMVKFMKLLDSMSKEMVFKSKDQPDMNVMTHQQMDLPSSFELSKVNSEMKVKLKYYYDLGTEKVVMQTRFGIDGDVVTRIEKGFASDPSQVMVDLHQWHMKTSVNYWKFLINVGMMLIKKIINPTGLFKG